MLFAVGPAVFYLKAFLPYAPLVYSVVTALVLLAAGGWIALRFFGRLSQERAALYIEHQ